MHGKFRVRLSAFRNVCSCCAMVLLPIVDILFLTIESAPCDTHIEKRLDTVVRYMMTIADFSVPTIDKLWKTFVSTSAVH